MIEKPINEQFIVNILPVIETVAEEADYTPNSIVIRRNNNIVSTFSEAPIVAAWNNGYLLTFYTEEAQNDLFSCEVTVVVDSFSRIFREEWLIVGQSYQQILETTPVLVNLIALNTNGIAVSGVYMYVYDAQGTVAAKGYTDQNGVFSALLAPGTYARYIIDDNNEYADNKLFIVSTEL